MKRAILAAAAALAILAPTMCSAQAVNDAIGAVGVDRFAHAGVSYIINDQLHRNCHFNRFWAAATTLAIGAAKEVWMDDHFDRGDFAADCAGVLMYQVRF
ncbi:hypothetical protein [Selenomonas bovis]|uniref:hypothetical protein n=1 Tax=Selenomonas bovis TaxID=416586 RepID=UPI003AB9385D